MRVLISPSYYKFLNPLNETMICGSPFLGFNSSLFLEKKISQFIKKLTVKPKVTYCSFFTFKTLLKICFVISTHLELFLFFTCSFFCRFI